MDEFLAEAKKDDHWVRLQRKTFTRWINGHLDAKDKSLHIESLEEGLKTGVALHKLLEIVSGETLKKVNAKARMPVQYIENINTCLEYLKRKGIKLVGIGAEDIHDCRTVLVLGLIWTLILRFQIVMDSTDVEMGMSFRDGLLAWCNRVLNPQGIHVRNFTDSWQDGRAFCGLVNVLKPAHVNLATATADKAEENMNLAFDSAEQFFEFPKLLDAIDVINTPDDLSIMTYVSYYKHYLATKGAVAEFSYAEGPGLVGGESMTPAHFKIITMTAENERCQYGGANLNIKLVDAKGVPVCEVDIKDHLDGTYDCSYEAPRPGKFKLDVCQREDAPFHPVIEPGEPEPGKCTAEGEGLSKAVAGVPAFFKITARDSTSSPINKGGAHFSAVLKEPSGDVEVKITDNKDGTYDCEYIAVKVSKAVELMVKLSTKGYGEGDIEGSSFVVQVLPGAPSADTTYCSGEGTKGAKAGIPAPVTAHTMDACGNKVLSGGAPITGTLTCPGGEVTPVVVVDNKNGTYSLDYVPEKAGTYLLDVKMGDKSVKDSPFTIVVEAGEFDPLNFTWEGLELDAEGRRIVVAGNTDSFKVGARDSFGNTLASGGLAVGGSLSGPSDVKVNVQDTSDGFYALSYTPFKTGLYQLVVDVDGIPLGGAPNPCKVLVVPANADGAHSVGTGPGLQEASVGSENPFTIQARDAFDNDITMGGAEVGGSLAMADGTQVPITVVDNGDGTYSCSYPSVKKAGTYQVAPTLNGSPIKGAPFTVVVKPGAFSSSEVEFPEEHVSSLDGPRVKLLDSEMNLRVGGCDRVTGEILPLDHVEVAAVDKSDGTFDVKYPAEFRGQYQMQILVNGVDTGVTHVVDVKQNELSPEISQKLAGVAAKLSPESAEVLKHLLLNATDEEREIVLKELATL